MENINKFIQDDFNNWYCYDNNGEMVDSQGSFEVDSRIAFKAGFFAALNRIKNEDINIKEKIEQCPMIARGEIK